MKKKIWYFIAPILAGILISLDRISKIAAERDLYGDGYSVIDGVFRLRLSYNRGAAWGIFQGKMDFLSILSILGAIAILIFFIKIPEGKRYTILRLLTVIVWSGTIGNLIDRLWFGKVTDFLYFELIDFPIFNVADVYITVGMFIFLPLMIWYYKDEELEFIGLGKKKGNKKEDDTEQKEEREVSSKESEVEDSIIEGEEDDIKDNDVIAEETDRL